MKEWYERWMRDAFEDFSYYGKWNEDLLGVITAEWIESVYEA